MTKVELAEFLSREGAYEIFDATEVTEVMQRFDKDGNGHLRYRTLGGCCSWCRIPQRQHCVLHQLC